MIHLSEPAFNMAGIKLIVAAITSNVSPPLRLGDTLLSDWRVAGLLKAFGGSRSRRHRGQARRGPKTRQLVGG